MKHTFTKILLVLGLMVSLACNAMLFMKVNHIEKSMKDTMPQTTTPTTVSTDITDATVDVVKSVRPAIVTIEVYANGRSAGSGSGVVYQKDGNKAYVITNHHVVDGADAINALFNSGDSVTATLLGSDRYTDLAVLEIEPDFEVTPITIGDSTLLDVGETVLAIGSPLGSNYEGSTTKGIISGVNRTVAMDLNDDGQEDWDMTVLQTDAAINPGNSGGALINMAGELVGITSMKISSTDGMGFAIPISDALTSIEQLKTTGKVARPVLGIQAVALSDISIRARYFYNIDTTREDGVYIYTVQKGSAASTSGLKAGDIIIGFDDAKITTYKDFLRALYAKQPGDTITLTIERETIEQDIEVTLK